MSASIFDETLASLGIDELHLVRANRQWYATVTYLCKFTGQELTAKAQSPSHTKAIAMAARATEDAIEEARVRAEEAA